MPGDHKTLTGANPSPKRRSRAGLDGQARRPSVRAALADIVARRTAPARVLICGSLYLAGTVLAENG